MKKTQTKLVSGRGHTTLTMEMRADKVRPLLADTPIPLASHCFEDILKLREKEKTA